MLSYTINWKTTLAGLAVLFTALADAYAQYTSGGWPAIQIESLLTKGSIAFGLIVAKDFNVTGGKKPATSEAAGRVIEDLPVPPPPVPRGFVSTTTLAFLLGLVLVCMMLTAPMVVRAEDTPKFGGCLEDKVTCFGPSVSLSLASISLRNGTTIFGVAPGVGYGVSFQSDKWYRSGLSGYVAFRSTGVGTKPVLSGVASFAEYLRVGLGVQVGGGAPFRDSVQVLLGVGADFGLSR